MFMYPVQRQMLPLIAQRISSSEGAGLLSSSAVPTSIIPGVQNPHCRPCSWWKPSWIGLSLPPWARPSTVVIRRPSAIGASSVHDFTGRPSRSTVQAPQLLVSQPMWVPVNPSLVRMRSTSRVRGSQSALRTAPFTVTVTFTPAPPVPAATRP